MHLDVRTDPTAHRYRCLVDGMDVTARCFAADDEAGWADCYVLGPDGRFIVGPGEDGLVTERLHGDVVLEGPYGRV